MGETMNAVTVLVEQRDLVREEADNREGEAYQLERRATSLLGTASEERDRVRDLREEVKRFDVAINALGGEPVRKPRLGAPFRKASA